jgi:hypothetical protein
MIFNILFELKIKRLQKYILSFYRGGRMITEPLLFSKVNALVKC